MKPTSGYQPIQRLWRVKVRVARYGERHYQDRVYAVLAPSSIVARVLVRRELRLFVNPSEQHPQYRGWMKILSVSPWRSPRVIRPFEI